MLMEKKGEQMLRCPTCGAENDHFIGCVRRLREIDHQPELGYRPSNMIIVSGRDPIMDQGGSFNNDDIYNRPTLDPDEYT